MSIIGYRNWTFSVPLCCLQQALCLPLLSYVWLGDQEPRP